jgi:hypothetical protein
MPHNLKAQIIQSLPSRSNQTASNHLTTDTLSTLHPRLPATVVATIEAQQLKHILLQMKPRATINRHLCVAAEPPEGHADRTLRAPMRQAKDDFTLEIHPFGQFRSRRGFAGNAGLS